MKEEIRAAHMKQRDIYELKNSGQYRRCYPSDDPVSRLL
jgi:hypothetical protein